MIENTNFLANTYSRMPVTFVKGEGVWLWDDNGKKYLDMASGIAVCSLGHCHPAISKVVSDQLALLVHTSNLYWTLPQMELAMALCERSFAEQVFFCNSGTESVESALKLAKRRGNSLNGPDCYQIVCLENSFHGRTMGALSATCQPVYQRGFEPLVPGMTPVPAENKRALSLAVGSRTAAVILEPIQGEGGVRPVSDEYLRFARQLCDEFGALLIFDEVQVGIGRTGSFFAYEQTSVVPDVLCIAKALGNGLPIGAMLASKEVMSFLPQGSHASTFGGNPVVCQAAKEVVKLVSEPVFLAHVKETGQYLNSRLNEFAIKHPWLAQDVRGRGLIQAMELKQSDSGLAARLMTEGVMALVGHGKILRLVPPLVISKEHIDLFMEKLELVLK